MFSSLSMHYQFVMYNLVKIIHAKNVFKCVSAFSSNLFVLLLYWSVSNSWEVQGVCVYFCLQVCLCLSVSNLSRFLNSLRDLPENGTLLLLGSLLHIEGAALKFVCMCKCLYVWCAAGLFPFAPTVKQRLWGQTWAAFTCLLTDTSSINKKESVQPNNMITILITTVLYILL